MFKSDKIGSNTTMTRKSAHIAIGKKGEIIALEHLRLQGHEILATNWRHGKGELDIVSTMDQFIIITEVKTRSDSKYGEPHEDVDNRKQELLEETAEAYVNENCIDLELRFDIISITLQPQLLIDHIEDAF